MNEMYLCAYEMVSCNRPVIKRINISLLPLSSLWHCLARNVQTVSKIAARQPLSRTLNASDHHGARG